MSSSAVPRASWQGDGVEMISQLNEYPYEKGRVEAVEVDRNETLDDHDDDRTATKSTHNDAENMRRMRRSQQLVRHFRLLSVASFTAIATAA